MKVPIIVCMILCISLASSCKLSTKLWNGGDTSPPLLEQSTITTDALELYFNEPIQEEVIFRLPQEHEHIISSISVLQKKIRVTLTSTIAGKEYQFETTVHDITGNSSIIVDSFYGHNERVPTMLISEFICEGSKTNGDKIELAILSDGNTAGMVLQEGIGNTITLAVTLPALEVKKGEFIVVHLRPYPQENIQSELKHIAESTHKQAYTTAWDVFSTQDKGISNTNATLVLLSHPKGAVMDAVLYSTKTDKAEASYKGFGTNKTYYWAQQLLATKAWGTTNNNGETEQVIAKPSLAVNPYHSTTTRSISRNAQLDDTNTKRDWHITPTRGSTFGKQNTDEEYSKQ